MEVLQFVGYRMAQSGGTSDVLVTTELVTLLNTGIITTIIAVCRYSFSLVIASSTLLTALQCIPYVRSISMS